MENYLTYDDVQLLPAPISEIKSRNEVSLKTILANNGTTTLEIDIPIVSSPMDTVTDVEMIKALSQHKTTGFLHRFSDHLTIYQKIFNLLKEENIFKPICISFGMKDNSEFIWDAYENGARCFLLDVANGHNIHVIKHFVNIKHDFYLKIKNKKTNPEVYFILGNFGDSFPDIRSFEHTTNNFYLPDAIRVGIGGGSVCSTRLNTGHGVPMITSILKIRNQLDFLSDKFLIHRIPIIADGGIRNSGDIVKALAAGADSVMLGSLLSATKESPAKIKKMCFKEAIHYFGANSFTYDELKKKKSIKVCEYRGSASFSAKQSNMSNTNYIEGESLYRKYRGSVHDIIPQLCDGIRSGLSYSNSRTIEEFHNNVCMCRITTAGLIEAQPHALTLINK